MAAERPRLPARPGWAGGCDHVVHIIPGAQPACTQSTAISAHEHQLLIHC